MINIETTYFVREITIFLYYWLNYYTIDSNKQEKYEEKSSRNEKYGLKSQIIIIH